jgi:hypothetical protein
VIFVGAFCFEAFDHVEGSPGWRMVSDFGCTTVPIEAVGVGHARGLLAEAGIVIGVGVSTDDEEVVHGPCEWEFVSETGRGEDLAVLRVEPDTEAGDFEWLVDTIAAIKSGETFEHKGDLDSDEADDD